MRWGGREDRRGENKLEDRGREKIKRWGTERGQKERRLGGGAQ